MTDLPDGWIPHDGGPCPVDPNATVRFKLRGGFEDVWPAHRLIWQYGTTIWETGGDPMPSACEITAYKPEEPTDDR